MPEELSKEQQVETFHKEIDALLDRLMEKDQDSALQQFKKLCEDKGEDKEEYSALATDYLVELLEEKDTPSRRRGWIISALAAINQENAEKAAQIVAQHIDQKTEKSERVRMWSAAALAKLNPPDIEEKLQHAAKDQSFRVKATALRLLVERQADGQYLEELQGLLESTQFDARWAALRVLRGELGDPLPDSVEKKLLPYVVRLLHDNDEWRDVGQQAALALGSVVSQKEDAIRALSVTIKDHPSSSIRRDCTRALANLKDGLKDPLAQETLLYALNDEEPQIRNIAVETMKSQRNKKGAIELIINELVRQRTRSDGKEAKEKTKIPEGYIEALRYLDDKQSAELISQYLLHPDPEVVDCAVEALTLLGGETAIRTLQAQRAQMLKTYTSMLEKADERIMSQFETMIKQARLAFRLSMAMHGIIFVLGVVIILVGLGLAAWGADDQVWIGVGSSGVGVATLLQMFYRDPFRNIGHSVNNLVKVNVVFLGYVRQINQIDATFKQVFFSAPNFDLEQMKETVAQIEDAVKNTLEKVKVYLPE